MLAYCPIIRPTAAVDFRHGFRAAAPYVLVDGRIGLGPSAATDRHRIPAGRESIAEGTPARQAHSIQ